MPTMNRRYTPGIRVELNPAEGTAAKPSSDNHPEPSDSSLETNAYSKAIEQQLVAIERDANDTLNTISTIGVRPSRYLPPKPERSSKSLAEQQQRRELFTLFNTMRSAYFAENDDALNACIGTEIHLNNEQTYRVKEFLSAGNFGTTFIAEHPEHGDVVVKAIELPDRSDMYLKDRPAGENGQMRIDALRARSPLVELATMYQLNKLGENNPAPQLLDAEFQAHPDNLNHRLVFIVMEQAIGTTVEQWFEDEHTMEDIVTMLLDLTKRIKVSHDAGIIHSDLKPSNLMVDDSSGNPTVQLLDFGIAKLELLRDQQQYEKQEYPDDALVYQDEQLYDDVIPMRPSYARGTKANPYSKNFAIKKELPSAARDRYALGRIIQLALHDEKFNDWHKMQSASDQFTPAEKIVHNIAERLTRTSPDQRATLDETITELEKALEQMDPLHVVASMGSQETDTTFVDNSTFIA